MPYAGHHDLMAEALALVTEPYERLDGLLERADALARRGTELGLGRIAALGRLARVDVLNRTQRMPEAVQLAHEVLRWSSPAGDTLVTARVNALLATGLFRLGAWAQSIPHAEQAVQLLDESAPLPVRVDHALILALVASVRAGEPPVELFERADRLARELGDPVMIVANLNNLAWTQFEDGDIDGAAKTVAELRAVATAGGHRLNASVLDTVAAVLLDRGALDGDVAVTDADAVAAVLLTYSEIKLRAGDHAGALRAVEDCQRMIEGRQLGEMSAVVLRQVGAIRAATGDYRAAYEAMVEFQAMWEELRSRQGEATASVMQVLLEVDQARRDSVRYQELAERDGLTGLWNRRHVDGRLPGLLDEAAQTGQGLAVALIDLDHFKQVNDGFSHDTGDVVLREVAHLLAERTGSGVFAARLGGEEFLLVYSGRAAATVPDACEDVRLAIAGHPWSRHATGLAVTTSIGVTAARPDDTVSTLLRRADEHLYTAKRGGRNRTVADPAVVVH
jgi:diguanylate cyclase (GGDEF)-like protein